MSFSGYHFGRPLLGLRSMRSGAFRKFSSSGLGKLKSGSLTSSKLLSQGGLSISRNYIKSKVSKILNSDVSDISDISSKVNSGLTKDYVGALETQAKADAQAGTYGKDGKAAELQDKQMKKYVSPDRDTAIAQVSKLLTSGSLVSTKVKLAGLPYTASITKERFGINAELFDEYGEKFASYDSKSGQWKSVATKAETQFKTASSSIYGEAFRAAQSGPSSDVGGSTSSVDVRV